MGLKFDFFRKKEAQVTEAVSLSSLRRALNVQLQQAYAKRDPRRAFAQAANNNNKGGDMTLLGMLLGVVGADLMPGMLGEMGIETADAASFCATALEVCDQVSSDGVNKRTLSLYPEGRRKPWEKKQATRVFNLVSNNDNQRMERDAVYETAVLHDMLNDLARLEKRSVSRIELTQKQNVRHVLGRAAA